MSEYTPTTEEVRNGWASCAFEGGAGMSDAAYEDARWEDERAEAQFDRWLAAEKAKWQAEALREAAAWLDSFEGPGGRTSLHDQVGRDIIRLLRERADRIAREKGSDDDR